MIPEFPEFRTVIYPAQWATHRPPWRHGRRATEIGVSRFQSSLGWHIKHKEAHAENYHLSKSQHETVLNLATLQLDAKAAASLSLSPHAVLRQPPCAFAGPKWQCLWLKLKLGKFELSSLRILIDWKRPYQPSRRQFWLLWTAGFQYHYLWRGTYNFNLQMPIENT